jgi:hypothetical protein
MDIMADLGFRTLGIVPLFPSRQPPNQWASLAHLFHCFPIFTAFALLRAPGVIIVDVIVQNGMPQELEMDSDLVCSARLNLAADHRCLLFVVDEQSSVYTWRLLDHSGIAWDL